MQNIVTVLILAMTKLVDEELCTLRQSKNLKLLDLHAPSFVYAFQYLTIRTPYRKLRQIFSDKQLKLIRRKSITALTYEVTKQNRGM